MSNSGLLFLKLEIDVCAICGLIANPEPILTKDMLLPLPPRDGLASTLLFIQLLA